MSTSRNMVTVHQGVARINFNITVSGGTGFHDFVGTGQLSKLIIAGPAALKPGYTALITDSNGQGIAGGTANDGEGHENNFDLEDAPCMGTNRLTISAATQDGVYACAIYGNGSTGDWSYA